MYTTLATGPIGVKVPFAEAARLAQKHGFGGLAVGIQEVNELGAATVRRILADHGLIGTAAGLPTNFREDDAKFEASLAELPAYAEAMANIGCYRLITWLKPWHETLPYADAWAQLRERSARICEVLAQYKIDYGLEFVGPYTSRKGKPNPFIYSLPEMLKLIAEVGAPNMGVLLDCWHWYTAGDTAADLERLTDRLVTAVHVNDAPAGIARDDQVDNKREMPGATGVIDMGVFMGTLSKIGYTGPVIVEPFSDWVRSLSAEEAVAATMESLKRIWPA
jgi:sugar phosphate isomerase/epimerase